MKNSLRKQIKKYIQQRKGWIHKGELERAGFKDKNGSYYLASTVTRMLRDLESNKEIITREDKNGKSVEYKFMDEIVKPFYITHNERIKEKKKDLFEYGMYTYNNPEKLRRLLLEQK